jgi:hypothetical protein
VIWRGIFVDVNCHSNYIQEKVLVAVDWTGKEAGFKTGGTFGEALAAIMHEAARF